MSGRRLRRKQKRCQTRSCPRKIHIKERVIRDMSADKSNVGSTDVNTSNDGAAAAAGTVKSTTRVTTTIDMQTYERLKFWSEQHDMSINEYLRDAIELKIRHENKDFDVPNLLIQRMNQMIDAVTTLGSSTKSLEHIVVSGFDSLLGLTRGENDYLSAGEDEDIME